MKSAYANFREMIHTYRQWIDDAYLEPEEARSVTSGAGYLVTSSVVEQQSLWLVRPSGLWPCPRVYVMQSTLYASSDVAFSPMFARPFRGCNRSHGVWLKNGCLSNCGCRYTG